VLHRVEQTYIQGYTDMYIERARHTWGIYRHRDRHVYIGHIISTGI
jgi:hypothetical protein